MQPVDSETKKDLLAAVHTAQELGPDYENEVIDSFLQRLDARLDAQVAVRVRRELDAEQDAHPDRRPSRGGGRRERGNSFQYFSLVAAIPLSAIAGSIGHLTGLVVVWAGIVGVNIIQLGTDRRQSRAERATARRDSSRDDWG